LVSLRKLLPTLELPDDLCASDHVLDAFVAAIMARLAKLERTRTPVGAELEAARAEGWIHLPKPETSIAECIAL
jgi:hypothetical protein